MAPSNVPRMPWGFLGGYLVYFIGLAMSLIGGLTLSRELNPPISCLAPLGLLGAGVVCSLLGSAVMARVDRIEGKQLGQLVILIMTPLPSLIGLGINYLGAHFRQSADSPLRFVLAGFGTFCLAVAGSWLSDLWPPGLAAKDFREVAWAPVGDLGLIALLIAFLPQAPAADAEKAVALPEETAAE